MSCFEAGEAGEAGSMQAISVDQAGAYRAQWARVSR